MPRFFGAFFFYLPGFTVCILLAKQGTKERYYPCNEWLSALLRTKAKIYCVAVSPESRWVAVVF